MLSQNAINTIIQMSEDTLYNRAFPLTNKAGGSKANRDAVAELKKAEMIKTYTNTETPEGCVMVRFHKKAKEMLTSMGSVGHSHAGAYAAKEGAFNHAHYETRKEDGKLVTRWLEKEIHQSRAEGPDAEVVTTVKVLSEKITSVL